MLVTRRLPSRVLAPLERIATIDTGPPDGWPRAELLSRVADAAGIISQLTDRIDGAVIDAAPSLRIIANVAAGLDNIDLLARENIVLAPHIGSATRETRIEMADLAVRNVIEVLAGRPPLTPVH